ncbi:hypothetical protein Nepgr_015757 [Nepenthes gracilis]|uniref:Uncharacterized protein n=1 Tax=Nepenthes gracilis TaxID=150966 RepID=A0AAD3SP66_NEPGR|nr:hypothetical protein Nepgr_015757 [Nepenthes gracilis]
MPVGPPLERALPRGERPRVLARNLARSGHGGGERPMSFSFISSAGSERSSSGPITIMCSSGKRAHERRAIHGRARARGGADKEF